MALDVGWEIYRDEVNNDVDNVDLANGQQHVVTVKRFNKGRAMSVYVSKLPIIGPRGQQCIRVHPSVNSGM